MARYLHLDGVLTSAGGSGTSGNSGGGSGGSVLVLATNFSGHGQVVVSGGSGNEYGHGGAGGRIAAHVSWFREYSGDYIAFGGYKGDKSTHQFGNGAGGTIYFTDSNSGITSKEFITTPEGIKYLDGFRKLLIDNDDRNKKIPTIIMTEDSSSVFEFDELEANNHVVLQMQGQNSELVVHKFNGDKTGLMHILAGQVIHVEYKESTTGYTVAPVSYLAQSDTEIVLPSTVIMLGTRSQIGGLMTNVQNLTVAEGANVVFYSTSQTALRENGSYVHMTEKGNISLSHLVIQRGSKATFLESEASLVITINRLAIRYQGRMSLNTGTIYSDSGVIESEGVLWLAYEGYEAESGPGGSRTIGNLGYGASHGGHGGAPSGSIGGPTYDSVYKPLHPGSGGGNGKGLGGRGGGYLVWENGKDLWIDGHLNLEGEQGQGQNAGGGSGGGLIIVTLNFTGYGHVDVSGGAGSAIGSAGGGSGGRMGIHIKFKNRFAGWLDATGGLGSGEIPSGAAGTVYTEETDKGPKYADIKYDASTNKTSTKAAFRRVEVNNKDIDKHLYKDHGVPWLYTVITEGPNDYYEFDEMDLQGHANLQFGYPLKDSLNVTIVAHKFHGDNTGLLNLRELQQLFVEVVESVSNETFAPCSFKIEAKSEIVFPKRVNLFGRRTWMEGLMTGVEEFMIRGGADVKFYPTAHTAYRENSTRVQMTEPGNFDWSVLKVMCESELEFTAIDVAVVLTVSEFYVKYHGLLMMKLTKIESTYAHIEAEAEFNMNGKGNVGETGLGRGWTNSSDGAGLGAGHGGWGGGNEPVFGGEPYNSVYEPGYGEDLPTLKFAGSGGGHGDGVGGAGGGYLIWNLGDLLEMNGILSLNGDDGLRSYAGGGSGGSVLITTTNMTGHGIISVRGGSGNVLGGGGAGGRISIKCRWRYQYGGQFHNYGGDGGSRKKQARTGAAGTTYKEENLRELEYRLKKYDPVHNTTFLAVDHTYVQSDNYLKYSPAGTLLMANETFDYEFDEAELTGSSRLLVYHPTSQSRNVTVIIHKFMGDKTGILHLRSRQHVFVEVVEAVLNRTEAPCGFIIENGAEIILPEEVHIHGVRGMFAGKLLTHFKFRFHSSLKLIMHDFAFLFKT